VQANKVVKFELITFVLLIILGILWMLKPEGNIEPFFAFVSLSLIAAEFNRRGILKIPRFQTKHPRDISPLEISDDDFLFLDKLQKLTLPNDIYHPQSDELDICVSLANKGFFIKDGERFQLTNQCLKYFAAYNA